MRRYSSFIFFICSCSVFPTPFIEEAVFFHYIFFLGPFENLTVCFLTVGFTSSLPILDNCPKFFFYYYYLLYVSLANIFFPSVAYLLIPSHSIDSVI